ncbi:hypothetical protein BPORC_0690 [Bifidobacterium porcinum]|nr:hypothetical protein BPORC_0690 [Bifidobacterium porcinum]
MSQELSNRKRGGSGRHTASTVRRVLVALLTMVVILAAFAALIVLKPAGWLVDSPSVTSGTTVQHVSQTQYGLLCSQQMTLADDENFGDSEYQATAGNIASSALYAAFGSVYGADVYDYPVADDAQPGELSDSNLLDAVNVKTLAGDVTKSAQYIDAKLLEAKSGTGVIGSMASWATSGDLKGMSAASCVPTALSDTFLLPATQTGVTEQLVVSNPSQKSTSLDVTVYGTKHAGKLSLSTSSTLTVAAGGQATLDIAAAAPGQQGVYVTVSSKETPISSVVKVIRMQGLKPQGSDVVLPLQTAALTQAMPGVVKGDAVTALVFAQRSTTVTLSWVTDEGRVEAKTVTVPGNRVTAVDLGNAPDGTLAYSPTPHPKSTYRRQSARVVPDRRISRSSPESRDNRPQAWSSRHQRQRACNWSICLTMTRLSRCVASMRPVKRREARRFRWMPRQACRSIPKISAPVPRCSHAVQARTWCGVRDCRRLRCLQARWHRQHICRHHRWSHRAVKC